MANIFFRHLVSIPTPGLIQLNPEDVEPIGPNIEIQEENSWDHWILGGGSNSLVGIKNGTILTPISDGISWDYKYVTITGNSKGLASNFTDRAVQTVCGVFRVPPVGAGNSLVYFGAGSGTGGSLAFMAANSLNDRVYATIRGSSGSSVVNSVESNSGAGIIQTGNWIFVALSENVGGSDRDVILYLGGVGGKNITATGAKDVTTRKVAIGPAYYNNPNFGNYPCECAEFIIFDDYLESSDLDDIYARSKSRMLLKGLKVV